MATAELALRGICGGLRAGAAHLVAGGQSFRKVGYDFASYAAAAHTVVLGYDPYHRPLAAYPGLIGGGSRVIGSNGRPRRRQHRA